MVLNFTNFTLNIVSYITPFILGFLSTKILLWFKNSSYRKMWKSFISKENVTIVLTTYKGTLERNSPKVSYYEVEAVQNLQIVFSNLKIKSKLIDSNVDIKHISNDNMVILGGPKINNILHPVQYINKRHKL